MILFKKTLNYILPLIVIIFLYFGINYIFNIENRNNIKLDKYTNQIKIYKNMLNTTTSIDILKDIENLAFQNSIKIRKISHLDGEIKINYFSKYENNIRFLYDCENLSKLIQFKSITFKILKDNDTLDTNVVFQFGKKINIFKNTSIGKILDNPFNNKKENIRFNLTAIVGDIAYINGKILLKGDLLFGYKIIDIKNASVILQKSSKKLILKVFNE